MPLQPALSKMSDTLGVEPDGPAHASGSSCRRCGLGGIEGAAKGVDDGDGAALTTIVSMMPMARAASVSVGPRPLLRLAKNLLCRERLVGDAGVEVCAAKVPMAAQGLQARTVAGLELDDGEVMGQSQLVEALFVEGRRVGKLGAHLGPEILELKVFVVLVDDIHLGQVGIRARPPVHVDGVLRQPPEGAREVVEG